MAIFGVEIWKIKRHTTQGKEMEAEMERKKGGTDERLRQFSAEFDI